MVYALVGLRQDTVFLGVQIRSLDPDRFYEVAMRRPSLAGTLPAHRMAEVERALRLALEL